MAVEEERKEEEDEERKSDMGSEDGDRRLSWKETLLFSAKAPLWKITDVPTEIENSLSERVISWRRWYLAATLAPLLFSFILSLVSFSDSLNRLEINGDFYLQLEESSQKAWKIILWVYIIRTALITACTYIAAFTWERPRLSALILAFGWLVGNSAILLLSIVPYTQFSFSVVAKDEQFKQLLSSLIHLMNPVLKAAFGLDLFTRALPIVLALVPAITRAALLLKYILPTDIGISYALVVLPPLFTVFVISASIFILQFVPSWTAFIGMLFFVGSQVVLVHVAWRGLRCTTYDGFMAITRKDIRFQTVLTVFSLVCFTAWLILDLSQYVSFDTLKMATYFFNFIAMFFVNKVFFVDGLLYSLSSFRKQMLEGNGLEISRGDPLLALAMDLGYMKDVDEIDPELVRKEKSEFVEEIEEDIEMQQIFQTPPSMLDRGESKLTLLQPGLGIDDTGHSSEPQPAT